MSGSMVDKIEVIRAKDLEAGDMVLIKCKREDIKIVSDWAEMFFDRRIKKSVIFPEMEFEIIKDNVK